MTELPPQEIKVIDGDIWYKAVSSDDFVYLGHAPSPRNAFEGFIYHVAHGVLMRYPLLSILQFAWQHRNSFQDTTVYEIGD